MTFSFQCLIPQTLAFMLHFWPSLIAELVRVLEDWSLCDKQPQPVSGLELLCSHLQYVAFLASEFPLLLHLAQLVIWVAVPQHFSSSSKAGQGKYLDALTCVQTSLLSFIDLLSRPRRPQPTSLWASTGHLSLRWGHPFFPVFVSHLQTNYLSPQGNLLLVHDTSSEPTVWICFPLPMISNLHSAERQGKISRGGKISGLEYFF